MERIPLERAHADKIIERYSGTFAALRLHAAAAQMSPADASHARELARNLLRAAPGCLAAGLYRALQPPPEDGWASAAEGKAAARSADLENQRSLQATYNIREQQRVRQPQRRPLFPFFWRPRAPQFLTPHPARPPPPTHPPARLH